MTEKRILSVCLFLAACAAQQIPDAQQEAYFTCPGIIVDTATENLQRAGYITSWREGDESVETKWASYTIASAEDRRTLFLRYVVEAANDGVRFELRQRSDDVRGEAPWDRITEGQVKNPGVLELLEKLRADVCGTGGGFFTRTSTRA